MGHVVCVNTECGDLGIVKDNQVTLHPGEHVICGACGGFTADTTDPLTSTVTTLPDGRMVRQTGYEVEVLPDG